MLNPALDAGAAAAAFARDGRVLIHDFLDPAAARRLHHCLDTEVPWGLTYTATLGADPMLLQANQLAAFDANGRSAIRREAGNCGLRGFAFHYGTYMMVTAYLERRDPGLALHFVVEFLNSHPFLDLMARISDMDGLVKANAQATRYHRGDFLKLHTDGPNPARKLAYVINLTRNWREEWGGLLHFTDAQGRVLEAYYPAFNSLSLFRVPAWHFVSEVAEAADHPRYAITGWVLDR
ncbi:MAG: 2OG-Fe(II) oxygenase [Bacillota bacterium]